MGSLNFALMISGVASRGEKGQSAPLTAKKKNAKNQEKEGKREKKKLGKGKKLGKRGKNWEREKKSGTKGKKQEDSFTLPLLTDEAGYATAYDTGFLTLIS